MWARGGQNERRRLPQPCSAVLPGSPAQRRAGCCPHCCPRRAGVGATAHPPLAAAPRALFPCWREGLQFNLAEALSDALYLPCSNSAAGKSRQLLREESGSWRRHSLSLPSPHTTEPGAMASARGVALAAGQRATPPPHTGPSQASRAGRATAAALSQPCPARNEGGDVLQFGMGLGERPPQGGRCLLLVLPKPGGISPIHGRAFIFHLVRQWMESCSLVTNSAATPRTLVTSPVSLQELGESTLKIPARVQGVNAVLWPKGDALACCSSAPPPPYPKDGRCC